MGRLSGTLATQGPEGELGALGLLGGVEAILGATGGVGGVRGVLGLAGTLGTQGPAGYRGIRGIGAPRGCRGPFWGIRGCQGVQGCIGVASGLGAQPHWAPVQGPSTPTGSHGGVTYLAKAKQVTEMGSAGYHIHLKLYFMTVFTFVSTPPCHIFLHAKERNVIWTIFSADQFTHILTLSI